ncbi:MAG TPA: ATP-binding protein [Chitinophagales bacterium]|nr:ATP-binding protein [Chitinophagales bacterium]
MNKTNISLRLPNDTSFIPSTIQFISEYARILGFSDIAITQIEMSAEEGISNVIKHAFLANESAHFDVHLKKDITGLTVRICDQGLPFDPSSIQFNEDTLEGLGSFVMSKMMDKIQYINLGKAGKELILTKYFEEKQLGKTTSDVDDEANIVKEHTYIFRPFLEKDAIEVARCAYESYGYTYAYEHIYYPERVKALNESEDLISVVAEADDGTVCGHMALVKQDGYDSLYEIGLAMTKQQYRGGNIFAQLLGLIYEEIERRKIHAVYGQCVTTHTYSQRNPVKIGMIPSALLPAYAPDDISFKNIAETERKRTAVLIVNKILIQNVKSEVYLPERYKEFSATIYNGLKADREIITSADFITEEMSQTNLTVNANLKMAKVTFQTYGNDFDLILKNIIHQLKKENIAMAEAFVNIYHKDAIQIINSAEQKGFRFSGLMVGSPTGDIAILQYLNGILPNTEKIQVVEPAQHLLKFIEQQFD